MAQSIKDQLVARGVVRKDETPEAKREAARAARPVEPEEKELPPPFEAPARGVIVNSGAHRSAAVRRCLDCDALLPPSHRADRRCAECAGHDD